MGVWAVGMKGGGEPGMLPLKRVVQEEGTAVRPYAVTGSRMVVIVAGYLDSIGGVA